MQNLQCHARTSENAAQTIIFDAARANPLRLNKSVYFFGKYFDVSFKLCADGTHEATVREHGGTVVAIARVDGYDV